MEAQPDINDVCNYIIKSVLESEESLSNLKLQKLLYYVQAWHLVFENKPIFDEEFEAWVHGPVSRIIYNRFLHNKSLYSDIEISDIPPSFSPNRLTQDQRTHIDRVLQTYAKFSGSQLEEMTHREEPWIKARKNVEPWERCTNHIEKSLMNKYYSQRLQK